MTYIPNSENLRSKVERHEQRPIEASALLCLGAERTEQKTIIKGSRFAACMKLIRFGVRDYDPEVGRWTSVEPQGFAGSRNWYVYAGNDGVNYLDLDGRKTIVIVTRDYGMGTHVALYIDNNGEGNSVLYDPNGGWSPKDEDGGPLRGQGDYFENPNMNDYYKYHTDQGSKIDKFIIDTTSYNESKIWDSIKRYENHDYDDSLDCSISVSNVLSETSTFQGLEKNIFFPGNLMRIIKSLINRKDRMPYIPPKLPIPAYRRKYEY